MDYTQSTKLHVSDTENVIARWAITFTLFIHSLSSGVLHLQSEQKCGQQTTDCYFDLDLFEFLILNLSTA